MATDIRTSSLTKPMDVADYLFKRLQQVGVQSIHGVPGDYNLVALDYVEKNGLNWVGNVNELNASYAADGYARLKGLSALVTTFGVGELSALNGIAGAYAEYVPVVHIVGTPSTLSQKNGMLLHHTLGNGDFNVFTNMSANISCVVSRLNDPSDAAELIDHAIRECYIQSRPAYITLPSDMVEKKVEGNRLDTPLDFSPKKNDPDQEDYAVSAILNHLTKAKNPIILVDACAIRHRALSETHELVVASGLPTYVAPMGKGAVDETLPNYCGVYAGSGSHDSVKEAVEAADLILSIGAIKSDFNTAGFTYRTSQLASIDFHSSSVKVKYSEYNGLRMNEVLTKVTNHIKQNPLASSTRAKPQLVSKPSDSDDQTESQVITHSWLWPHFTSWVREDDVIVTETGTSGYGIWEVKFQRSTTAISQILWGSIGYATGSAQGAALAAKEQNAEQQRHRRTILFTGDGSFQLTAQEVSTMIRQKLNPIIFVICNEGYTIERFIHGMKAGYNDVGEWHYKDLVSAFGAQGGTYLTYQIKTKDQLRKLLVDKEFAEASKLRFVELYMPKEDAPTALQMTAEASAKNNAKAE
ncbi:hypothetical protein FH972_025521 [Carpinus fangiana]|uniref:pyruvate decarboxylase n=1 Tax=Carpinus fangiana TaxID=176857 RepID=A0A5N6L191_9ROSI|nr:hypothetical protein FH972_025521 [Carpinus fangiana]